ncbi:siderophore-interacting protein [Micromonospora yangpuensis]|uniref:NADPH-dependent ferric siderophore reductase, contains FAD-binding and SIP domains n=1 Tax=Micromonospora yangpuensis TaxID=683228 RepID=A0A1C6UVH3_9ACTN|nr:siderophore-interacting protein [Micromonospora yangpuensis]GGM26010.1 siderophore-interacting protein [Micromonospora yangpuensis]SCL58052.1 NADPH-dependent ferric siderophore reductase, contains FAD-binding and SIP domains [Micromonospora yangpuensis]
MSAFRNSPNVLFETTVTATRQLSPGFVRVTLGDERLRELAPYQLDQRIKIMLPVAGDYPAGLRAGLVEQDWRRAWRSVPDRERPQLRSYTAHRTRPAAGELDLDFYLHQPHGPASGWAAAAQPGERLLLSGPHVGAGQPRYGVQWEPGPAVRVLVAADETAYPAVRGILSGLGPQVRATVLLEAGTAADAASLDDVTAGHEVEVRLRGGARGGTVLTAAVGDWLAEHGRSAAGAGNGFYAWTATESSRIARVRGLFAEAGVDSTRVHTQGYWHDRPTRDEVQFR